MNTDDILSKLPPEAAGLIKEAGKHFGNPEALNTWLLTPVSPTGKRPIDYLLAGELAIFRGFLLRVRAGQEVVRILSSGRRVGIERSREKLKEGLRRLRPTPGDSGN